ncbi:hypothetical protein ACJX0J_029045, partial [Zea mays]
MHISNEATYQNGRGEGLKNNRQEKGKKPFTHLNVQIPYLFIFSYQEGNDILIALIWWIQKKSTILSAAAGIYSIATENDKNKIWKKNQQKLSQKRLYYLLHIFTMGKTSQLAGKKTVLVKAQKKPSDDLTTHASKALNRLAEYRLRNEAV